MPRLQSVAQQRAARSWAVTCVGSATATWTLSAAASTATNTERVPFPRTEFMLLPVMSPLKREPRPLGLATLQAIWRAGVLQMQRRSGADSAPVRGKVEAVGRADSEGRRRR